MSANFGFERLLESVLEADGPAVVPPTVVEAALTRSRSINQRRPRVSMLDRHAWPARRMSLPPGSRTIPSPPMRVLLLAVIAMTLIAFGVVGSALVREDPPPKELQSRFFRHFEYAIPVDSAMRISGYSSPELVAWAGGPDTEAGPTDPADGAGQPHARQVRGVVIGRGGEAWSHGNGGRFMLRTAPEEFLTDLRDTAHTPMGPIEQTTLDGWPALTVMLPGTGGSDIHVTGRTLGLSGIYVRVTMPSRLIVSDVDGTTIFILIWARTAQELDKWLPVADEFVESIHFVEN